MKKLARYWIFIGMLLCIAPGISMAATIDVLIVYTPAARDKADYDDWFRSGVEAINAKIAFMVSEANNIFLYSGINDHRLRLVGRRMINYDESNNLHSELNRLADFEHFNKPEYNDYQLELMSVATVDDLPWNWDGLEAEVVIVALVGTNLHIRIFDKNWTRVVDKAEDELTSGEDLTALKQLLNPFPDRLNLTGDEVAEILEYVNTVVFSPPPLDGYMDTVHKWRNEVGADIVNLITATDGGAIGGVAKGITSDDGFSDHKGFFVNDLSFEYVQWPFLDRIGMLFTHELGHVLGCHHYRWEDKPPGLPNSLYRPYAYAHKFWAVPWLYGTVMATPDLSGLSIPIPHFSNPDVLYQWVFPTGTSEANNAGVIMETAPIVAGYRETAIPHGSIWVDTAWGGYQNGSVSYPYNSVQDGIDFVDFGGTIVFEHGSDPWTGTITKPMTLTAGIGEMVIGQ